jgi:hypothetical protein
MSAALRGRYYDCDRAFAHARSELYSLDGILLLADVREFIPRGICVGPAAGASFDNFDEPGHVGFVGCFDGHVAFLPACIFSACASSTISSIWLCVIENRRAISSSVSVAPTKNSVMGASCDSS